MENNNIKNKNIENKNIENNNIKNKSIENNEIYDKGNLNDEIFVMDDEKRAQVRDYILTHMDNYSREAMEKSLLKSNIVQEEIDIIFEELGFKKSVEIKKSNKKILLIIGVMIILILGFYFVYSNYFI